MDFAFKSDLAMENPVIYYISGIDGYEKINCEPATIKKDLGKFFKDL